MRGLHHDLKRQCRYTHIYPPFQKLISSQGCQIKRLSVIHSTFFKSQGAKETKHDLSLQATSSQTLELPFTYWTLMLGTPYR